MKTPEACSCAGSNPNCFKCGGWGYIDDIGKNRASSGPVGQAGKSASASRRKKIKNQNKKSKNSCDLNSSRRSKKISSHSGKKPEAIPGTRKLCRPVSTLANKLLQKEKSEDSKLMLEEKIKELSGNRPTLNSGAPRNNGSIQCKCGSRLAEEYFHEHLIQSCALTKNIKQDSQNKSKNKPSGATIRMNKFHMQNKTSGAVSSENTIKIEDPINSRHLDATKEYSKFARDRGVFGSHPSHDDYGDESSA